MTLRIWIIFFYSFSCSIIQIYFLMAAYYEFMRLLWREDKKAQNRELMESLEKMAEDLSFEPGTSGSMEDDVAADYINE